MSDDLSVEMNPGGAAAPDETMMNPPSHAAADAAAPLMDAPSVFLSVVSDGPLLAFCAYDDGSDTLYIETARANGFDVESVITSVLIRLRPTMLLLPTKLVSNASLLQVLTTPVATERNVDTNDATSNDNHLQLLPTTTPYKIIKSSWLDVNKCRQMVLSLRVKSLLQQSHARGRQRRHHHHSTSSSTQLSQVDDTGPINNPPPVPTFGVSHYHALASLVDFDSKVLIQAMGSLLLFLQGSVLLPSQTMQDTDTTYNPAYHTSHHPPNAAAAPDDCLVVSHLEQLHVDQYVYIPASTIEALHIFRTDHHPLALVGGHNNKSSNHKSKEGYSLLSWLDRTHFADARVRLREWMHQPLRSVDLIAQRQDGVELFTHPAFLSLADMLADYARQLRPAVASILGRMAKNAAMLMDYVRLAQTLTAAIRMCELLQNQVLWKLQQWEQQVQWQRQEQQLLRQNQDVDDDQNDIEDGADDDDEEVPPVHDYAAFVESILEDCHLSVLQKVRDQIVSTIDIEGTTETLQLSIWKGVSQELDRHREQYSSLKVILERAAATIQERFPALPALKVVFFPQLGYFVTMGHATDVAADNNSHGSQTASAHGGQDIFSDIDDAEGTHLQWDFHNCNRDFYRTMETKALDRQLGDVDLAIKNDEFAVVSQLEDDILVCSDELRITYSALADLDCILSFAEIAREQKLVRPLVVDAVENCIIIESGGHPLQEQSLLDAFIRNHTAIDETSRVHVVTGPNYTGKSCYARQVGILTYMAHLGCFLPCAGARISIVDRILAQFSAVETCMVPQSSFQLDLTNMGGILRTATRESLILIDEFGKGTSPASGIALLAAGLQSLCGIGCKVVCTTHFLEIFSVGLLLDGANGVKASQMTVEFSDEQDDVAVPTFSLVDGLSTTSAGLSCAHRSGVKASVIERAREIVLAMREGRTIRPLDEILFHTLSLTVEDKATIHSLISTDLWQALPKGIEAFQDAIYRMHNNQLSRK